MFIAENEAGQCVQLHSHDQARQLRNDAAQFVCPVCRGPVLIRNGAQIPAHFAHRFHACTASEPESAEHLQGKLLLQRIARGWGWQADLEVVVRSIQQRIDVLLVQGARRIAVEFQCSPLATVDLARRTAGYHARGLEVLWVLGSRYQQSSAAAAKFAMVGAAGLQLTFLNVYTERMWRVSQWRRHTWQHTDLWPTSSPQVAVTTNPERKLIAAARQVAAGMHYRTRAAVELQNSCYAAGHNVAGCPWCVHREQADIPGCIGAEWAARVRWLLKFEGQLVTPASDTAFWLQQVAATELPLVDRTWIGTQFADANIAGLVQQGYLQRVPAGWRWLAQPEWFADVDHKIAAL